MARKSQTGRKFKFAQSCDSRQCRAEFKKDIIKNVSEAVATPHELDLKNRTVTCIYCGKVTKLAKKKES